MISPFYKQTNGREEMKKTIFICIAIIFISTQFLPAQDCVVCHKDITPNIVTDWQLSKHSENDVDCSVCHGDGHNSGRAIRKRKTRNGLGIFKGNAYIPYAANGAN